jgi:hypothetical protein
MGAAYFLLYWQGRQVQWSKVITARASTGPIKVNASTRNIKASANTTVKQ